MSDQLTLNKSENKISFSMVSTIFSDLRKEEILKTNCFKSLKFFFDKFKV